MADTKISAFPAAAALGGTEDVPMIQAAANVKATPAQIKNYVLANDNVTFAMMQNLATDRLIGRDTAGTGDPESLTVSGGIEFTGTLGIQTSAFTGDVTKAAGGTVQTLATVNSNVGTWGSAGNVPQFTVNGKGLITAAGNVAISITSGSVSDFVEAVQDVMGAMLVTSTDLTWTYNDAANTLSAALKGSVAVVSSATAGTDTYTATGAPTQTAYVQWRLYLWKCPNANTGAATVNWDSLGAKSIVKITSTALSGGELVANVWYWLLYDGTNMLIVGSNAVF